MAVNSFNAQNPPVTTKGDVFTFSTIPTRLAVGANNTVLTADSTTATGLKWATASSGPTGWSLLNAGGTALTGAATVTVSSLSAKRLLVLIDAASTSGSTDLISVQVNSISTADYSTFGISNVLTSTYAAANFDNIDNYSTDSSIRIGRMAATAASNVSGYVLIDYTDTTGWKNYQVAGGGDNTSDQMQYITAGFIEMSAAITSVSIVSNGSNFDAGTVYVMGAN